MFDNILSKLSESDLMILAGVMFIMLIALTISCFRLLSRQESMKKDVNYSLQLMMKCNEEMAEYSKRLNSLEASVYKLELQKGHEERLAHNEKIREDSKLSSSDTIMLPSEEVMRRLR